MSARVAVIGAGASGLFTSIELANRGFDVSLIDRGLAGSGTSGRFHGLLHSGARYAVTDRAAALECSVESEKIVKMAPYCVEQTGGLFVALNRDDEQYGEELASALRSCAIKFEMHDTEETLGMEPNLSREAVSSISVRDGVLKGGLFIACALVTAVGLGVRFMPFRALTGASFKEGKTVESLKLVNTLEGKGESIETDFVVNCSGPWMAETSKMLNSPIEVLPAAGIMSVADRRLVLRVINRMRRPSDGDILVPYGSRTIAGTTAAVTDDPAAFEINGEDVQLLLEEASAMVPAISDVGFARSYASFRPLVREGPDLGGRSATRDFRIIHDGSKVQNVVSVVGGKMTTCRLVGEKTADAVTQVVGDSSRHGNITSLFNPFAEEDWKEHGFVHSGPLAGSDWKGGQGGADLEDGIASLIQTEIIKKEGG